MERFRQSKAAALVAAIVVLSTGAVAAAAELTTPAPADGVRLRGR